MRFTATTVLAFLAVSASAFPQAQYDTSDPSSDSTSTSTVSAPEGDATAGPNGGHTGGPNGGAPPSGANGPVKPGLTSDQGLTTESQSNTTANNADLIRRLETAPTVVDRLKLLNNGSDFLYDFNNPPEDATTTGDGGHTVKADRKAFPALVGTGVSMTLGFLGPCGFNTPHTHPRSSEINVVAQGELVAESIVENGASIRRLHLGQYQMTVFPQGAVHTEYNPSCEQAVFVAGFASEDPGVQQSLQTFMGLDNDIIQAAARTDYTFSGDQIDQFRAMVPHNVANGVDACLKKCNIQKRQI